MPRSNSEQSEIAHISKTQFAPAGITTCTSQEAPADQNYGCFLAAASSFRNIFPISGFDMNCFHTNPVR